MVRYNNKYEKNQRKKLQNISKKNEQQTTAGKKEFTTDPWLEKEYKNLTIITCQIIWINQFK